MNQSKHPIRIRVTNGDPPSIKKPPTYEEIEGVLESSITILHNLFNKIYDHNYHANMNNGCCHDLDVIEPIDDEGLTNVMSELTKLAERTRTKP
jgi:hypothetical protein